MVCSDRRSRPGAGLQAPGSGIYDNGGSLGSLTLTLNLTPVPYIKIQPEIRYDYTSYTDGLNGKDYQFIIRLQCTDRYMF